MHAECMAELAKRVKEMRRKASNRLEREGRLITASYDAPGEMRGYRNVLELICPNPMED